MQVKRVRPITTAFKNKSLAPFKYLADMITEINQAVRTISDQKAYLPPLAMVGPKGLSTPIPGVRTSSG